MTHRGPFQPLLFCDSVIFSVVSAADWCSLCFSYQAFVAFFLGEGGTKEEGYQKKTIISCISSYLVLR